MVDCLAETNACFGLVDAFWIGICGLLRQPKVVQKQRSGSVAKQEEKYLIFLLKLFYFTNKARFSFTKSS